MSMTTTSSDGGSVVPAARSVPLVAGDTPAMREWAEQLVARAGAGGVAAPAARPVVSGVVDRRDRDQGPGLPSREPARVCRDRREHGRRTRRARTLARADGR